MKTNTYKITASNHFQAVIQFLRTKLAWKAGDPLVSPSIMSTITVLRMMSHQFTYINLEFAPAPDDTVSNLYKVCVLLLNR